MYYLVRTYMDNLVVFADVKEDSTMVRFVTSLTRSNIFFDEVDTLYSKIQLLQSYSKRIHKTETFEELQDIAALEAL